MSRSKSGALFMMDTLRTTARILALSIAAFVSASAQQAVAPPPKPADSGPTLEETMKFIQDNLEEGKLTYTAFVSDASQPGVQWKNQFKVEMTHLVADAKTCRISFHWRAEVNGKVS